MQITRSSVDTQKGPADWFTGDVYIDAVAAAAGTSTFAAALVHFTPGARTAWHTHPHGQTIFVTEGTGLCQREGGPIEIIRPGDRVFFEPGENHGMAPAPAASWLTLPCSRTTSPAPQSHGAGTSLMRGTAQRRRAPTDGRRCRLHALEQRRAFASRPEAPEPTTPYHNSPSGPAPAPSRVCC